MAINMISNPKEKFLEELSKTHNTDNILQYYDNVTYNIRFYMISNAAEVMINKLQEMGKITNDYTIPNEDKIIIAETGVSSKFSIDSLALKTVHANMCNSHSATTYSIEMTIKEANGCQLTNQIASVSKLLGYEGYILQPYHIDVWFSGYDNSTHLPIKIIPEVGVLTYKVILGEVKTQIESSGTTYNFICQNIGISSVPKEMISLGDKGKFTNESGLSIIDFTKDLVRKFNINYFDLNPQLEKYYPKKDYLHIRLIDDDDINANNLKPFGDEYYSSLFNDASLSSTMFPESISDSKSESGFHPSQDVTLSSVFQEFCLNCDKLDSYIARPIYKTKTIDNKEGMQINQIYVDVVFSKSKYMETFIDRFENNTSKKSQEEIERLIYMSAYLHLKKIKAKGLLTKRYDWLFNGKDTSVLEITSSVDKLWYANIPIWDIQENSLNQLESSNKLLLNELMIKASIDAKQNNDKKLKELVQESIKKSNKVVNNVRYLSNNHYLYLEDIYYTMDKKTRSLYLNNRKILEKVQPQSIARPQQSVDAIPSSIIAKTGYYNIFGSGNLIELQFKILGDPYWIQLCSDKCLYSQDISSISNMHYFIFKMNTCADQKLDGTYDLENVVDFCNIYQIVESTSLFEGGNFVQNIKAIVSPEFLTLGRLEI